MTTEPINDDTEEISSTITPKELAHQFGTDPKTLRKFLRSLTTERPGKGGRWAIRAEDADALQERFDAWNTRSATVLSLDEVDDEN